ncbi:hypothetical protein C9374_010571 [Naegleria lovaniensis]|uniref:Cysteine dioxygenase n=1 Tax=Naegleria lovaniensis TaxID=51637 RepID=A0AA88GBC9_NAELO|nr:uncharacterized protein C9374_010571 [Naegleria lovaniensis]KAG2374552.1 hypothetical protein C9374_010571 [Naegleria lovaniensis]
MQRLLRHFSKYLPLKQIYHQQDTDQCKTLILERYNIFSIENGPGLVLHRFVHSDPDRGYHDHPWQFGISLILSGSYREIKVKHQTREIQERIYRAGSVNYFNGKDYHRVLLYPVVKFNVELNSQNRENNERTHNSNEEEEEVWTLFFHWKRVKHWGFLKQLDPMKEKECHEEGQWEYHQYSQSIKDADGAWWERT